jgi:hypothetical protein
MERETLNHPVQSVELFSEEFYIPDIDKSQTELQCDDYMGHGIKRCAYCVGSGQKLLNRKNNICNACNGTGRQKKLVVFFTGLVFLSPTTLCILLPTIKTNFCLKVVIFKRLVENKHYFTKVKNGRSQNH